MREVAGVDLSRSGRHAVSGRGAVSASRPRGYDRWRDADGTHVPVGAWVKQTEVDARRGALRSRLHAQGHHGRDVTAVG
jgi:hypothetical protein